MDRRLKIILIGLGSLAIGIIITVLGHICITTSSDWDSMGCPFTYYLPSLPIIILMSGPNFSIWDEGGALFLADIINISVITAIAYYLGKKHFLRPSSGEAPAEAPAEEKAE